MVIVTCYVVKVQSNIYSNYKEVTDVVSYITLKYVKSYSYKINNKLYL